MTAFFELFQPGLRHLRKERDRQKMLVAQPTHGGGPPLGIDLDAGTARISIRRAVPKAARKAAPATDPVTDPVTEPYDEPAGPA